MEIVNMKIEMGKTGPKPKAPEEKTYPVTVYARKMDIEKVSGKRLMEGGLEDVRNELRSHFAKLLKKAK